MLSDWNTLLAYLAEAGELDPKTSYDLIIVAGNSLPHVTAEAGRLYQDKIAPKILLTGGIGHATHFLLENYRKIGIDFDSGLSEAEMNQRYLTQVMKVPDDAILAEGKSANSGENALFSLGLLEGSQIPEHVLLMQDPILQRRIKAAFLKVWENECTSFTNYVPVIPQLESFAPLAFTEPMLDGVWEKEYFIDLVLGEIPRLINDEQGYGPKGKGFIIAVDVPEKVKDSFYRLNQHYRHHRQLN